MGGSELALEGNGNGPSPFGYGRGGYPGYDYDSTAELNPADGARTAKAYLQSSLKRFQ